MNKAAPIPLSFASGRRRIMTCIRHALWDLFRDSSQAHNIRSMLSPNLRPGRKMKEGLICEKKAKGAANRLITLTTRKPFQT